jgi:hypothetical protein
MSVAFCPDGTRVVTAGTDKTARIYRRELFAPLDDVIALARTHVLRDLTCAEQQQYLHTTTCTPQTPIVNTPAPTARAEPRVGLPTP